MNPTTLLAVMSPTAAVTVILTVYAYYRSGMKEVNDYEKDLKELRIQVIKGNVGHKTFRYMKDNLREEHLFVDESKRLDDMFQQGLMDEITYIRMKQVLQLTFNQKLMKIDNKHSLTANPQHT
jgi:tRNA A37 N6-isopentenylltransferase MiaA